MRTLAQIRSANAFKSKDKIGKGQGGGDAISGFPALIRTDGLLAALAFAIEPGKDNTKYKHEGHYSIAEALCHHFMSLHITQSNTPEQLVKELSDGDSVLLRRTTAESLSYLSYLKRFVKKTSNSTHHA